MAACNLSTKNPLSRWLVPLLSLALALPILLAGQLRAEEEPAREKPGSAEKSASSSDKPGKRSGRQGDMRKRMMKKFDADGDGELSEDERAELRKFMQERRGMQGKKGTRDGKSPQSRRKAGKGRRGPRGPGDGIGPPDMDKLFEQFDHDGDGKLDRKEFGNALQTMHEKRMRMEGRRGEDRGRDGFRPRSPQGDRDLGDRERGDRDLGSKRRPQRNRDIESPPLFPFNESELPEEAEAKDTSA